MNTDEEMQELDYLCEKAFRNKFSDFCGVIDDVWKENWKTGYKQGYVETETKVAESMRKLGMSEKLINDVIQSSRKIGLSKE